MIQILTYSGKNDEFIGRGVEVNSIHDAKSLDDFEINIIDLNDKDMWKYHGMSPEYIESTADIKSMEAMIANSCKTEIVVLFPQNIMCKYHYSTFEKNILTNVS